MPKILLPNTYVENIEGQFIYLAGPIKGASDWQSEAIGLIPKEITIASPRRAIPSELCAHVLQGDKTRFKRQREWERYYMELAARKGALLFWLPGEQRHHCEKAYGANTRLELGEWMTRLEYDPVLHIVFGSDGKFSDLDVIMYDLRVHAVLAAINGTLSATCLDALSLL